jgi:hypothetical protein
MCLVGVVEAAMASLCAGASPVMLRFPFPLPLLLFFISMLRRFGAQTAASFRGDFESRWLRFAMASALSAATEGDAFLRQRLLVEWEASM